MKTFIAIVAICICIVLGNDTDNDTVCPTPACIVNEPWEQGSIYEIVISDGCPRLKGKEVLLSAPLELSVKTILTDNNTSYGDFAIEYKYIYTEDVYIANLLDEFVEL